MFIKASVGTGFPNFGELDVSEIRYCQKFIRKLPEFHIPNEFGYEEAKMVTEQFIVANEKH